MASLNPWRTGIAVALTAAIVSVAKRISANVNFGAPVRNGPAIAPADAPVDYSQHET